jgi:hypothetical protein
MHLIKFALGIISLIFALPLAALGYAMLHIGPYGSGIASCVFALFFFDLGLEWSFAKGMAPWWKYFPATDSQKVIADELGVKYSRSISRGELSNLIFRAKYRGHIPKGSIADSRLCEVYSAATIQAAHSIKTALENAGIDSLILGDHLQNALGDLPAVATIAPEVWVRTEYSDVAREIIAKLQGELRETKVVGTALGWECDECGESNESNFDICWNCQAAHDS